MLRGLATILGLLGSSIIAFNIGFVWVAYIVFLISSLIWVYIASTIEEYNLMLLNIGFSLINAIGIYNWIG